MSENETVSQTSGSQSSSGKAKAIDELQALVDQIVKENISPYIHYLKARQLGLIDSRLALVDRALESGIVRIREVA